MKTTLRSAMVGGILLTSGLAGFAATPPRDTTVETPRITVRVYNYAEVPFSTLEGARNQVDEIFRHVGVEVAWQDCFPCRVPQPVSCNELLRANEIVLRVLRRPKGGKVEFERTTGGAAFRIGKETGSGLITLYYDRVEQIARYLNLAREVVLAHIAAHEMGHLLLPAGSHSQQGIMRGEWTAQDWLHAEQNALVFTPEQSHRILAGVLARGRQQDAYQQTPSPASAK